MLFSNFSLTLHPNKIYIASGQTAGRMNSGRDGQKVIEL